MKITDVRIRLKDEEKLKGIASITIDECFVVHDIKVIDGKDGLFVSMPSKKHVDGEHRDIAHPIKTETREYIKAEVLAAYNQALETKAE
ncbi:MAG: septation regulator SpoVG [Clostridia bacterium]|nr:septation regulator SpoVG [Clostridia bacterium]